VTGALEIARAEKRIGSSLQAAVHIFAPASVVAALGDVDLAELCITSAATIETAPPPAGAFALPDVPDIGVIVSLAPGDRCERCWRVLTEVGHVHGHDDLCQRCADVIDRGAGAGMPLAAAG